MLSPPFSSNVSASTAIAAVVGALLMHGAAATGYVDGVRITRITDGQSLVRFKSGEAHDYQAVIRYAERGLIYFDPVERKLKFTTWDLISGVDTRPEVKPSGLRYLLNLVQ
jgi:hypothetical protein